MRFHNISLIAALVFSAAFAAAAADPPPIPKISEFAPAEDLIGQVDFFVGRAEQSLATPKDFDLARQARTVKDANTLAVLALMLAVHDQMHPLRNSAPAMLAAAQRLATAEDNYETAAKALAALKAARAGGGAAAPAAKWEKVGSLGALMKQVPLIHTALKRGVEPGRLKRQAAQSAGQSAALAAIAQASMLDIEHVANPADVAAWREYCAQMREACGMVNSAVRNGDQDRVAEGMQRLTHSCDACHAKFRQQ